MFKTPEELSAIRTLLKFATMTKPILKLFGVKPEALEAVEGALAQCDTILELTRFNDVFASRGWILHGWLDTPLAKQALEAAEEDRWEEADQKLIAAYSPDHVRLHLTRLGVSRCFERRKRLALLALEDYEAGRYHACIPVTLALLDGMGQELTGLGFLRQGVRFAKTGSFLEIGPGVTGLIRRMTESRGRVRTEPLDFPYRHGILHGTDLGYDTELAAAKAWGALLAVGSYAVQIENPPPPKDPPKGLLDTLKDFSATQARVANVQQHCASWAPREDLLAEGPPQPGTPEEAASMVLEFWTQKNYGKMAGLLEASRRATVRALAGQIRSNLECPPPDSFAISEIEDVAPATSTVTLTAKWQGSEDYSMPLRLHYYVEDEVAPRSIEGGHWLVFSFWPLETASLRLAAIKGRRT